MAKTKTVNKKTSSKDETKTSKASKTLKSPIIAKQNTNRVTKSSKTKAAKTTANVKRAATKYQWLIDILNSKNGEKGVDTSFTVKLQNNQTVEFHSNSALKFMKKDNIEYAIHPSKKTSTYQTGYIRMPAGSKKMPSKTFSRLSITILMGTVTFEFGSLKKKSVAGEVITIPKDIRYGMVNNSNDVATMKFIAYT